MYTYADLQFPPNLPLGHTLREFFPVLVHEVISIQLVSMGETHQVRDRLVV